ncbi:MAG: hypothetical protein LEGION0398_MBIBDBAK_00312 [Legionellaceae bacterium]
MVDNQVNPLEIKLLQKKRKLLIIFDNGQHYEFSCEYLRVFSPSAEVQGHGHRKWVKDKSHVNIIAIEPVGQYAVKLIFDDGHQTGIYSWDYLYQLGEKQTQNWLQYQEMIEMMQ